MGNKRTDGSTLNSLVARLERILSNDQSATVEKGKRLRDADTGRLREHDVVITWQRNHHEIVTAIECRDRSRPIGVPDLEAFSDKCAHTGVHHAVMVSSAGFTNSAREKAKQRGISLLSLSEVERFSWMGTDFVIGVERRLQLETIMAMTNLEAPPGKFEVFDTDGKPVSAQAIANLCLPHLPEPTEAEDVDGARRPVRFRMSTQDWTIRTSDGKMLEVDHILVTGVIETIKQMQPVKTHNYVGDRHSYEVVTSSLRFGENDEASLVFVNDGDNITVYVERQPKAPGI